MNKNRMLLVGPELSEIGGVSAYCRSVLDSYPGTVEYFPFPLSMSRRPLLFLKVLSVFYRTISRGCETIQLNTSLNLNALARDLFFCLLSILKGMKPVVFIHGWDTEFQKTFTGLKRLIFRAVFNRAGLIIVLSKNFKDTLEGWDFTCPIEVETTCFSSELKKASAQRSLEHPRVLFLSRIIKEKGIFELVDACAGLIDMFPRLRLDMAGDGPDLNGVKDYVKQKGYGFVDFHGNATGAKKDSLFSAASVFCLPTYYGEGLPIAIIEAMYCGLPVITTGAGGIAEIFKDRENGLFVKPQDIDDLRQKLSIILSDNAFSRKVSRRNTEYAEKGFSPKVVARRLAALHRRCYNS